MTTLHARNVLAIAMQARVPVILYSEPGTGKSASVRAMADQVMRQKLYTIMLSVREPTDQGGMPAVFERDGEQLVRLVPPGWTRDLIAKNGGVVFFDEVSAATPATLNSALRIVQEGVVGDDVSLPSQTSYVLAANPPETNLGANEISAGMSNRCVHIEWKFNYQVWRAGMLARWKNVDPVPIVAPDWRKHEESMVAMVVSFLDTQPSLAQAQPKSIADQSRAWPSGRTWELTAIMLAAAQGAGIAPRSIEGQLIVEGLVGAAAATAWSQWLNNTGLVSVAELLKDPSLMPKRQDQILATLKEVVEYVRQNRTYDVYADAWSVVVHVARPDPQLAVPAAIELAKLEPPGVHPRSASVTKGLAIMKNHLRNAKVDYGAARPSNGGGPR